VRTGRHVVLVRWTRPFPRTGGALRAIEMLFAAIPNGKDATGTGCVVAIGRLESPIRRADVLAGEPLGAANASAEAVAESVEGAGSRFSRGCGCRPTGQRIGTRSCHAFTAELALGRLTQVISPSRTANESLWPRSCYNRRGRVFRDRQCIGNPRQ
jgi:hypothetical protein